MSVVSASKIRLTKTKSGVLRIGNTRVSLDSVIIAFNQGSTAEQIFYDYDTLTLSDVYAAISYYLQHRETVDSYLAKRAKQNEKLRESNELRFGHQGIREKLLARNQSSYSPKSGEGKYLLFKSNAGKYGFRLLDNNGRIIIFSKDFDSKKAALQGIETIRKNSNNPKSYVRKTSSQGEQYFVFIAPNGEIIAQSEKYSSVVEEEMRVASNKIGSSLHASIEDLTHLRPF